MLKAIETAYRGCRFRSRLEARWAVFFDALGLEWEYEPEGFELQDGTRYLPDFWLPEPAVWAEVKPGKYDEDNFRKPFLFVGAGGGPLVCLTGAPEFVIYRTLVTAFDDVDTSLPIGVDDSGTSFCFPLADSFTGWSNVIQPGGDLPGAIAAARSARFEFGESGAGL